MTQSPSARAAPGEATTQGNASATIVEPISVTAIDDLNFGKIAAAAPDGDGSVTIDPASNSASYSGSAKPACSASSCGTSPALFAVSGAKGRAYEITVPQSISVQPMRGAGSALTVSDLLPVSENRPERPYIGQLNTAGMDRVRVGGTLIVPGGTPAGSYRAEVPLVVSYN